MGDGHIDRDENAMRYKHDCDKCKPLGEFGTYDLYFCEQDGDPTVIARYGNDGHEYDSGLFLAPYIDYLTEAKKRAIEAGHLKP